MLFGKTRSGLDQAVDSVIGKETVVKGGLVSNGTVRIDGQIDGDITVQGDVIVGQTGKVHSNIKAANVVVAGEVCGNIEAKNKLEILSDGKLYGDINAVNLLVAEGASFKGSCQMAKQTTTTSASMKKAAKA